MNIVVYQEKQTEIKMEKIGKNSCTGNLRHTNIRSFFVKHRVHKGEVKIDYSSTKMMLPYYFTKPLKRKVFKMFRNVIMGYKSI